MMNTDELAAWETCALCHGVDGVSAVERFPVLAGQKTRYLKKQVLAFRAGRRSNDGGQMQTVAVEMSEADLHSAVMHFAEASSRKLQARPQVMLRDSQDGSHNTKFTLGQAIFEGRLVKDAVCVDCHGELTSPAPWLVGQHQSYLQKQLDDFREGRRGADGDSPMPGIAKKLTPEQISAVAYFLSGAVAERTFKNSEKSSPVVQAALPGAEG